MSQTKIEWADKTWNPVTGCTKVSEGCANCYAESMAKRFTGHFNVTCHPDRLDQPLKWRKPSRIFVCSMGDLFHDDVPTEFIEKVMLVAYDCPQHTFLVLTKRPERLQETRVRNLFLNCFMNKTGNIWLGVTAENQEQADWRVPILLEVKALAPDTITAFVSIEPMLGPISIERCVMSSIDWIIVGAESGPKRRVMDIYWAINVVEQCRQASVPVFVKQVHRSQDGNKFFVCKDVINWPEHLRIQQYPEEAPCPTD